MPDNKSDNKISKPPADADLASKQLDRVLAFFPRVEAKASFLFAVDSSMLGLLAINIRKEDIESAGLMTAAGLSAAAITISLFFIYRCSFPSLKGGHSSLIYFGEVGRLREHDYVAALAALSKQKLFDDLAGQAWRNSQILCAKYFALKVAFISTAIALIPWFSFLVLASIAHSQLPVAR